MKRIFTLIIVSMLILLALSSCEKAKDKADTDKKLTCNHTYRDTWSSNSKEHWRAATCDHTDLKFSIAQHTDANENGECDICGYDIGHEHTYGGEWKSDESHHWKAATCSHSDVKGEIAAHTDDNYDYVCDVCKSHVHAYNADGICLVCNPQPEDELCEHTYSELWSTNLTEHWHAATCEHAELRYEVDSHTDSDENGYCDVCAYELGHEHIYDDEWTYNSTHHWRDAICSHTSEKLDLATHTDSDKDGKCDACPAHVHCVNVYGVCTVCGAQVTLPDTTSLQYAISVLLDNAGKVNGGAIDYGNVCTEVEANGSHLTARSSKNVEYLYGDDAAWYKISTSSSINGNFSSDMQESWYERAGNGVFGVYQNVYSDGRRSELMLDAAAERKLDGYYFSVSTLASAYSPENLIDVLYKLSESASAMNFVSSYNGGVYAFSYGFLAVNYDTGLGEEPHADFYEIFVSFTLSDLGNLSALDVECHCYTNSISYDDPVKTELNNDYVYDRYTNTIQMKDNAIADVYSFHVTQTVGARTFTSPYPKSQFIPEDFDVFTNSACTSKLVGEYKAAVGKVFYLYVGNFTPEGTSISYIASSFSVSCDSANVVCFSNPITASVIVNAKTAGTYTIVITAGDIVKEVTVVATVQSTYNPPENSIGKYVTEANVYTEVYFTPDVSGKYTFTVPMSVGVAEMVDGELVEIVNMLSNATGTKYTADLTANVTYVVYIMADSERNVYLQYTVQPSEEEGSDEDDVDIKDLVIGGNGNEIRQSDATYVYTAEASGILTLTTGAVISGDAAFFYSVNGGERVEISTSSSVSVELSRGDELFVYVEATGYSTLFASFNAAE